MTIYAYDDRKGLKMLEEALRSLFGEKLDFHGFYGTAEFLQAAKKQPYDIAFADVDFNGKSGMLLIGELNKRYPRSNFIGVTNSGSVLMALMLHQIHASDYLIKPYDTEQLLESFAQLRYPLAETRALCAEAR